MCSCGIVVSLLVERVSLFELRRIPYPAIKKSRGTTIIGRGIGTSSIIPGIKGKGRSRIYTIRAVQDAGAIVPVDSS